jgi:ABC-type uncharacterized transport system involved in gliding motility auxiliary subunit
MRPLDAWARTILGTVGLLGLFGVSLALLYRYDLRLDLTTGQRYSLSPHAEQLLQGLTVEVELVAFLRSQNPRNPFIRDLLRRIGNVSPHVRWAEVDVNRSPAKAHQYGVTSYGAIVVKSGSRQRVVTTPSEDNLKWAILQVTRDETKTVYFVTGHGEKTPQERDRLRGYSLAAARASEELYQVRMLSLPQVEAVPEDATVLVIGGAQGAFSPRELGLLDSFLQRGGGLLVMLDPFEAENLAAHLARYGVLAPDEVVVDPDNRMFGGEFVTMRVPIDGNTHPITAGLAVAPVFSLARLVEPGAIPPGAEVRPILQTGPRSWATADRGVLAPGLPKFVAGRDRPGPITVGVEVRLPSAAAERGGRLVAYGNSEFASNFFLERDGNADLFLNTINWLADEPGLIAPRPPRKEPGKEQLLVLGEQGSTLFWLAVIVQPGICLLIAVTQFWYRRYAS